MPTVPLGQSALAIPRQNFNLTGSLTRQSLSLPDLHGGGQKNVSNPTSPVAAMSMTMKVTSFGSPMASRNPRRYFGSPKSGSTRLLPDDDMLGVGGSPGFQTLAQLAMRNTFTEGTEWSGRMEAAGVWGVGPNKAGVYRNKTPRGASIKAHVFEQGDRPVTQLRRYFERGDLPLNMRHGALPGVEWKVEPSRLDYKYMLPIFFDGMMEKVEPFATIAQQGLQDLLNAARGKEPSLLVPTIPVIIVPLRRCLNTRDNAIMCRAINALQQMIRCDERVGEFLVPYYRQILPTFNLYARNNKNLGDMIDYGQRKKENMGDLVHETLALLEKTGGEDAFINIKYMIPTYESTAGM